MDNAMSQTERKIYELIAARYALQFLPDYEYEETVVEFGADGETFRATGRMVTNLGWQGWEKQDETSEKQEETEDDGDKSGSQVLPAVNKGETGVLAASTEEKTTKPPKPYTYHALLAAMNGIHVYVKDPAIRSKLKELQGIGTEATQEGIIKTLFGRGYIRKEKKIVKSTELGQMLIDVLSGGRSAALTRPDLTALWEGTMSDIEAGRASMESFIEEVAGMVREIISDTLNIPGDVPGLERRNTASGEVIESPCPLCGKNARRYEGKYGAFWKCACSPDITFKDVDGVPVVKEARTEAACPAKGCKGKAVRLVSKKDNRVFWKCDKCGNFFDDTDDKPAIRERKEKK
jgi:DNA topoisomerase-3